jgi:spermidine/putrescine transport system substrate-binding protein
VVDGISRRPSRDGVSRRDFLRRSARASIAFTSAAAFLSACAADRSSLGASPGLARPDNPVTLPLHDDVPLIDDGLQPETNATLKIYNWSEYLWPRVVEEFAEKHGAKVEISNFVNMDEAISRLQSGDDEFDVFFHRIDVIGKLVEAKLLRPLNHSYIPNLEKNVWPVYHNPFYDQGARYGVPYTVYTTGIAWRVDQVPNDIAGMSNPYEIFWDESFAGKIHLIDDYREVVSMVLLKNGITDLNTTSTAALRTAASDLEGLRDIVGGLDADAFSDLPKGRSWIHQAWSGDMIAAQYYFPEGQDPSVTRYWFPSEGDGAVANDSIGVLSGGRNPVLAHHFLNYMLDFDVSVKNFSWNGYQPPMSRLDPTALVQSDFVPPQVKNTIVRRQDFNHGFMQLQLAPDTDAMWHKTWAGFREHV